MRKTDDPTIRNEPLYVIKRKLWQHGYKVKDYSANKKQFGFHLMVNENYMVVIVKRGVKPILMNSKYWIGARVEESGKVVFIKKESYTSNKLIEVHSPSEAFGKAK